MTAKFEVGKTYRCRSICNHDCIFEIIIVGRTEKTVTLRSWDKTTQRTKIRLDPCDGGEYIRPERFSMAPTYYAGREIS